MPARDGHTAARGPAQGRRLALAREIASKSPDAVRRQTAVRQGWTGTAAETLALEAKLQGELIGTPNQLAAVQAGLAKQEPEFSDPV